MSELFELYNARPRGAAAAADGEEGAELDEDDFDDEGAAEQYRLEREERARAKADARARAQVLPRISAELSSPRPRRLTEGRAAAAEQQSLDRDCSSQHAWVSTPKLK